jgi:hypothetical protein
MRGSWLLAVAAVISCAKKPPPPPSFSLADVAGTWSVRAMRDTGDAVLAEYQMSGDCGPGIMDHDASQPEADASQGIG